MRRAAAAAVYLLIGLIATWLACWIGSRLAFRLRLPFHLPLGSGCYEIGLCSIPWWATAALLAWFFGPSMAFAVAGWRAAQQRLSIQRSMRRLACLATITAAWFLASYVLFD